MKKATVAIVKIKDGNYKEAVNEVFQLLGGVPKYLPPLSKVMIKPNWVTDKHYTTGAVTNTLVLKALSEILLKNSAKHITIGDSAMIGKKTESVITLNGVGALAGKRVDVVDLNQTEYTRVIIPNALKYRRLSLPAVFLESDMVINVPVMKTHDAFPFTLGLKNMKGLLPDNEKRKFHSLGLDEGLIDLNKAALADFTLIDGSIAMEGLGPVNGTPVNLGLLIGSSNALAAEVVAYHIMGFGHLQPAYIEMAHKAGFGEKELKNIQIVGEKLEESIHPFESFYQRHKVVKECIHIHDETACSGCRDVLVQFASGYKSNSMEKVVIYAGDYNPDIDTKGFKTIGIGSCLHQHRNKFDCFVPGCAPLKKNLDAGYQQLTGTLRQEVK
ncbi:hypothetical protein acsn021_13030 [Anaerocolumna cellulosilytica]|uniref:Uncharacterized protein n=1 Tax=Anaerocolumna cellulosilytica TaxID=433286 RepID=A0A6S6QT02_9FIRM|nr:DUF362 domain-containing protein [Anaerocolumna cellulosilytica]MBB5195968.1 uncharacterized protein (DUF362 family) [Anaerocolumna cellulosilytica]BCJ93734.1 hypothetical protein acsn021_13030 [Anaerocolumna cellulosilytica]